MKTYWLLALLMATQICAAQSDSIYTNYHYFTDSSKTLIYYDDFSELNPAWGISSIEELIKPNEESDNDLPKTRKEKRNQKKIDKVDSYFTVKGGHFNYYWPIKDEVDIAPLIQEIDYDRNFEIEIRSKITGSAFNNYFGVLNWGRIGEASYAGQYLYYRPYSSSAIFHCGNKDVKGSCDGKNYFFKPSKKSYNPTGFNSFTIRKVKSNYYVFVNGIFQTTAPFIPLEGKAIGLGAKGKTKLLVDYIRISYLPD